MSMLRTAVISTGVANTASIMTALERAACEPVLATHATALDDVGALVLPGVGAFGPAMESLHEMGLVEPLRQWIDDGRPFLAVCLGMQLLAHTSAESPEATGLRVIDATIESLPSAVRVPHMGWNQVSAENQCVLIRTGPAYFANSFCLSSAPNGWRVAWTNHGTPFVSALQRGKQLACQFHPELSGRFGAALLTRWVDVACTTRQEASAC